MEKLRVAIDAMGGDNAPSAPVRGAVHALQNHPELELILLGDEKEIRRELQECGFTGEGITVINCTERIEMAEPPVLAIQNKKDSSIVKGMGLVRKKEAEAFVSAGNTGAVLVGGQVIVGRIKGVERPAIGAVMPTERALPC